LKKLKCLESYTRDVGRGIIRIDYEAMKVLEIETGGVVEVVGDKQSVAKVLPLYPSDEDKGICRLDGIGRNNTGVKVGEKLKLTKVKALAAEDVVIFALEAIPPIDERYVADAVESMVLMVGDCFMVPYFGGRLTFRVKQVAPEGFVMVTQKTRFKITKKDEDEGKVVCPTCGSLV